MSEPGLAEEPPLGFDPDSAITPYVEQEVQFFATHGETSDTMGKCEMVARWVGTGRAGREARVLMKALRQWLEAALIKLLSGAPHARWLTFIDVLCQHATHASVHSKAASELALSELAGPLLSILAEYQDSERLIFLLDDFIYIAGRTKRSLRDGLFTNIWQQLCGIAKRLVLCGAYDLQESLLRILHLMMPMERESRSVAAQDIFPEHLYTEEVRRFFVDYDLDQVETEGRMFLKQVNKHSGLVVYMLCDSVIQNGDPLLAIDGSADTQRYVYLNKGTSSITLEYANFELQPELFTLHSKALEYIRMSRADDESSAEPRVLIEVGELWSTPMSFSNEHRTLFQLYPCRNIAETHHILADMFPNLYKCDMTIDATVEDANQPASPNNSVGRGDERNNSTATKDAVGEFEEWLRRSRRRSTSSRPNSASSMTSNTTPIREKLERVNSSLPIFVQQFKSIPKQPILDVIPEISTWSTDSLVIPDPIEEEVEQTDIDLVNDLYEAALSGHEKSGSKKKVDVVDSIVNIHSEKEHVLNGNESDISIGNTRPSLKKTVLTKSKEPVLSKSPLLIENEVVNWNKERNLKNTSANNENEIIVKMKHPKKTTKSNKKNSAMEEVKSKKVSPRKKRSNLSEKLDIVNQNKEAGKESVIECNNSDTIPDTPNIEYQVQFGNVLFRKASKDSMKQSSKRDAKPVKVTRKETKKRNETKKPIKRTKGRVVSETDTTNMSSDSSSEDRVLYELNSNSNKTPAQQRKKRKLYSPQDDFIMQNSQDETNEEKGTTSFTSPKVEPYVLLSKLQLNPKRNTVQKCQESQKMSSDELFDQVMSSHTEYPTVDTTVATKNVDVYNLPSNSDSGEDFKKVDTKRKRKPSPIDHSPKLKKKMTKQKRPTKYNKKQLDKKINIQKSDVLQDERMRGEQHVKDLINISSDIEPEVRVYAEKEDIVPTGLDNIEIQSLPPHNDKSKLTGDNQTLNYIEDGQNKDKTTATFAEPISVTKLRDKLNKNKKKDVSKQTNKDKKKSKPVKYSQGEEELLPPLIVEVGNIQSKEKEGLNDFQLEMQTYLSKKTSNVLTSPDYLSRHLEGTKFPISVPHSPENNLQEELTNIVQNTIDEVTDTTVNHLNVTIESSQESSKDKDSHCRSISTNGDSPITARYNCDDVPPNVLSIDLAVPARDLETENLNVSDQNFIQQLRRRQSSPKKQDSASSASDSNIRMLCSYEGHLSPIRSVNSNAEMQSQTMERLKRSSTILIADLNETPQTSKSPRLQTGSLQYASAEPKQPEDKCQRGSAQLPQVNDGAQVVNAEAEDDTTAASDKLNELVEMFLENLETSIREPSHTFTTRLTTVFAKILRKVSDWSHSCKEDDDRYSQQQGREFELFQRRHLQNLQLQIDIRKQQKQQLQHILEELKGSMVQVCRDHDAQMELRLSMLREDIARMLR